MLKYIGTGDFLQGVPARDLSAEEVECYGGREALLATGLYADADSTFDEVNDGR